MASRYPPQSPPHGRRKAPPERVSTGPFPPSYDDYDPYYDRDRRDHYGSPKGSKERVIPVSTETFRNGSLVSSSKPSAAYDSYDDRRQTLPGLESSSRRSTLASSANPATTTSSASSSSRAPPAVIHQNLDRQPHSSARSIDRSERDRGDAGDYYVTPSHSSSYRDYPRHKKNYSVEDPNKASGVVTSREREDNGRGPERRRREPAYHLTGPSSRYSPSGDDSSYEYTTPREVFENTEPRWRSARRGSVDAPTRERPSSLVESQERPIRPGTRDLGPPPATRALERLHNEGVYRHNSLRDPVRSPPRNRDRDRDRASFTYNSDDEDYPAAHHSRRPKHDSARHQHQPPYSPTRDTHDDRRDLLRPPKRYEDIDVANRGFGIRAASVEPPRSAETNSDSRPRYPAEPSPIPPDFTLRPRHHDDRKREYDSRHHDRASAHDKETRPDREADAAYRNARTSTSHERSREPQVPDDESKTRAHHYPPVEGYQRDRYVPHEARDRDSERNSERNSDVTRSRDKLQDDHRQADASSVAATVPLAAAGTVALATAASSTSRKPTGEEEPWASDGKEKQKDKPPSSRPKPRIEYSDDAVPRQRHYVTRDDNRDDDVSADRGDMSNTALDPDEEYRRRVQQEAGRFKQSGPADSPPTRAGAPSRPSRKEDALESDYSDEEEIDPLESRGSRTLAIRNDRAENVLDEPLSAEPAEIIEDRDNRVRIVEPPKEKDQPKSILRKPTAKFPEDPNPIREGVAPHRDDKREIPQGMKWTKISRKMVNPQALEEAGERFEERKDFVIVLRAITKEQVQKLADRTEEIRKERETRPRHRDRDSKHYRKEDTKRPKEHDGEGGDDDEDEDDDEDA